MILFVVLSSCSFVVELLNMEAAEIISWSPSRECVTVEEVSYITVRFSNSMNRPLCEDAFSLTRDADRVRGNFAWREQDSVLVFFPTVPVSKRCRYTLTVAATAEDIYGNSLAEPFAFDFVTGEELIPPEVLSYTPADGATGISPRESIRVVFSEPIDEASFYSGFSLFPTVRGGFLWFSEGAEVHFLPVADYQFGRSYEVVLSQEISDRSGNRLVEDFHFSFRVQEVIEPSIVSVETVEGGRVLVPTQSGGGIDPSLGIEKDETFLLTFSQVLS
ncbi:MAG: Ig-like domain-containing protein, partial [Spirochaetales bacterium]|nr:Ig-like domain-containing protein [Spirochaetales bacterium]